jgi:hypothetical protein
MSIAPENLIGLGYVTPLVLFTVAHSGDSLLVAWAGQAGGVAVSIDH